MSTFRANSQNFYRTLLFLKRVILLPRNLFITLNGVPSSSISMMFKKELNRKLLQKLISKFLNSVEQSSQMKLEYFVLEEDIKTMFAVIGCSNTIIKLQYTDHLYFSDDQISLLSIVREVLSTLLVEMMQNHFTTLVKCMISRMTLGQEQLT